MRFRDFAVGFIYGLALVLLALVIAAWLHESDRTPPTPRKARRKKTLNFQDWNAAA